MLAAYTRLGDTKMATSDDIVKAGIDMLPPAGQTIEFDAFKAQLYAKYPDGGRDAFARMIKADLIKKELTKDKDGKMALLVSRLS